MPVLQLLEMRVAGCNCVLTKQEHRSNFVLMTTQARSRPSRINDDAEFNDRFWYWQGASGASYIHSVYPADACPPLPGALFISVRRTAEGRRIAIAIGRFDELSGLAGSAASPAGADELHVHMLARDGREGERILEDLRAAFRLPVIGRPAQPARNRLRARRSETAPAGGLSEAQLALFKPAAAQALTLAP